MTGSQPFGGSGKVCVGVAESGDPGALKGLHYEQSLDALLLALEQCRLFFQAALLAAALMQKLVAVMGSPAGYLARSGYLEPLRRRFVRFQLRHFSCFLVVFRPVWDT